MRFSVKNLILYKNDKCVLNDINFSITENEFLSIVTEDEMTNTYLKGTLLGFIKPNSGIISLNDRDITELKPMNRGIAYISNDPYLNNDMSIYDNIAYPLRKKKYKEDHVEAFVDSIIDNLGLEYIKGLVPSSISRFQALKVSIARSLTFKPELIIIDDILSSFDSNRSEELKEFINKVHESYDNPIIIYLGMVTDFTRKVLTIDSSGSVLDEAPLKRIVKYNSSEKTDKLLNLNGTSNRYLKYEFLDVSLDGIKLNYLNRTVTLNNLFIKRIFYKESVKKIRIDLDKLTYFDKGNSLRFRIYNVVHLDDSLVELELEGFKIQRMKRNEYNVDSFMYYPIDEIEFYDSDNYLISTKRNVIDSLVPCKVRNQKTGLVEISKTIVSLKRQVSKKIKKLIINADSIFDITNEKKGIRIKRIRLIEDLKDYYFLSLYLDGSNDECFLKVNKSKEIFTSNELYLKVNEDSFKIPLMDL